MPALLGRLPFDLTAGQRGALEDASAAYGRFMALDEETARKYETEFSQAIG